MKRRCSIRFFLVLVLSLPTAGCAASRLDAPVVPIQPEPSKPAPMTNARLDEMIRRVDPEASGQPGFWRFRVEDHEVLIITDENADRMRIITMIATVDEVDRETLYRMMQANFDSALDARYAVAKSAIWGAFIHPLSSLTDLELLSGIGQVVNLAVTYGSTYSSGALVFQGGDTSDLQRRQLIEELQKKGSAI